MIVSYLARLILLLPELNAAKADTLAAIAESSRQQNQHYQQNRHKVSASNRGCVAVNETLRKTLIQVSIFRHHGYF